jgi:hypothetical protein
MTQQVAEARAVSELPFEQHLRPEEIAAYIDGVATGDARARIESHLATCDDCRAEIVDASRIAATLPRARGMRRRVWIPAAAAAAVVLLAVWPRTVREPGVEVTHRESPVTATIAPRAIEPVGTVDSAVALVWTSVPHTDRYRVRLFDARGTVIWERETTDTTINVPATTSLRPGQAYFWKIEAQAGFGRSAATELVEFSVRHARRQ